ncbi:sulfatase [Pseudomonas sp. HMWF032]|nr:sulfatase [Pseudomonas sp. HMWF032]
MSLSLAALGLNSQHPAPNPRLRVLRLLALTCLSSLLLMADDFIQQLFTSANQAELELRFVVVVWLFSLSLWLVAMPGLVTALLVVLCTMQLIQLSHISFFGEPLTGPDIVSLFNDFAEVRETGWHSFADHWHVLPSVLLPYALLIFLHRWVPSQIDLPRSRWALLIIVLVLGAKPYRATYRDLSSFMPGPTRSGLHNSFNAFAFYAVRLAFRPVDALPQAPFQPYQVQRQPSTAQHVWLVVADSLRTDRLGVLGYPRNTTPNLSRMASANQLLAKPGIAAGVSTAVSLPNLLNLIREPGQTELLSTQPHNLFSLARQEGFRTHWLSAQESKLLSHLGSRHLDVSITREDHPLLFLKRHDHALIDILKEQQWAMRNFVVLNLRTAHLPYEENYAKHSEPLPLWPADSELPREQRQANAYDNAVGYLDDVLAEIIEQFDQLEGERYLIITGDHGQLLGEDGRWGHNDLLPQVVEVPVLVVARDAPAQHLQVLKEEDWISHYEAGVWLAQRLGWQISNPNQTRGEHFVQGKQLFGDNMIKRVVETPEGLQYDAPRLLSRWLKDLGPTGRARAAGE